MEKSKYIIRIIFVIAIIMFGKFFLSSSMLFFRLLVGVGLGYALTRAAMGFAGSVNRAYNTGSTKLIKVLMWMFLGTAAVNIAFLYNVEASSYGLWINQINLGLILGGLLFGFGMTFSACCASGVLTDLVTGLPRAGITLLFFGMGVFLGFPLQKTASWITDSWFTTETGAKLSGGVYLPDLFKWDGLNGYLGAILLTALFAGIIAYIAKKYEEKRVMKNTYIGVESEKEQYKIYPEDIKKEFKLLSKSTYEIIFVRPWTMRTGAIAITSLFALLMGVTKMGWGASTPYGFWFGKLLLTLGVPVESLVEFTGKSSKVFTMAFFSHPINTQNFGIILGTFIYFILAGTFFKVFKSELKITFKDGALFALGGLAMGFGTRLSNGCNVGALYTPIANFSLSGWIFLVFLILGGIFGNKIAAKIKG